MTDRLDPLSKIMDWRRVAEWRQTARAPLVFTNGVFDLLHPGHIDVLLGARKQGESLVVGVNSDASVKRLKGPTRPIRNVPANPRQLAWWIVAKGTSDV